MEYAITENFVSENSQILKNDFVEIKQKNKNVLIKITVCDILPLQIKEQQGLLLFNQARPDKGDISRDFNSDYVLLCLVFFLSENRERGRNESKKNIE